MKGTTMETMFAVMNLIGNLLVNFGPLIAIVTIIIVSALLASNGEKWLESIIEKHPKLVEEIDKPQNLFQIIHNLKN